MVICVKNNINMNVHEKVLRLGILIGGVFASGVYSGYCTQTYTCTGTCYRSVITYTSCGFLWLSRCTEYKRQAYTCDETCTRDVCCMGYTGSSCNTPLCDGSTSCPNGGTCQSPDYCSCPTGYSSPMCTDNDECTSGSHDCQQNCRNTPGSFACTCHAGYVLRADGRTCIVNCGHPGYIRNGSVSVTSTNLGGIASYTCYADYRISSGDNVRECQEDFTWSGTEPVCTFANHCGSFPCKNGATCENLVGNFRCDCSQGWSGTLCDNDIQPPVVTGCSEDVHINATDHTVHYSWTEPTFTDTRRSELDIVSNYESPEFTFPWGDFMVQYVATKKSNGLVTECTFQIKVRPTQCEALNIPAHGARLCNGWKTDFGRFCMITCQRNYTLGPPHSFYTWYVCGASGTWIAASPVPDCEVQVDSAIEAEIFQPEYSGYAFTPSCDDDVTRETLQNLYIANLRGTDGFSAFCSTYGEECNKENVDVHCSN